MNTLLWMDAQLEVLLNEGAHPVVDHQDRAVGREENGEVEYRAEKILMFAEIPTPCFELC